MHRGYKIETKLDESDTNSDDEYSSDEEIKHGYTFIRKSRKNPPKIESAFLLTEDYLSD